MACRMELNLNFNINVIEDNFYNIASSDPNYILYYVRVKPEADVKISCNVTKNGEKATVTKETATVDPNFVICGNMDTELIKYMDQLNKELVGLMNSCATYEELAAVVEEISVLLSTEISASEFAKYKFVKLADLIKNGVINK